MYSAEDKVFIVATGWSLKGFDFDRLKGRNVIAVNEAACYCEFDYSVVIDTEITMLKKNVQHRIPFLAKKPLISHHIPTIETPFNVIVMEYSGSEGFEFEHNKVRTAGNSGYMAINAAYHLGAKNVYLLGFDLGLSPEGEKYFYDAVDSKGVHPDYLHKNYFYNTMARDIKDSGFNVYNCSKFSKLEAFKKIDLCSIL